MLFSSKLFHPLIAAGLLLLSGSLFAEIPGEWDHPRQEIADAWRVRKEVVAVGTDRLGGKQLDQIQKISRKYGITALPNISLALLQEIRERGGSQKAELLAYAESFAPRFPAVSYFSCGGIWDLVTSTTALPSCIQGARASWERTDSRLRVITNLFVTFLATIASVGILFLFFLLSRYWIPVCRALSQAIPWASPSGIGVLFFLLSLLSWSLVGWLGPALILFALLWRYTSRGERGVLFLFWLAVGLFPLALYGPSLTIRYHHSIVPILEQPFEGDLFEERALRLGRWVADHPDDAEAFFTLGRIEKETGCLDEAKRDYQKAAALRPGWYKPIVNLSTISHIEKAPEEAVASLQKALSMNPRSVVANFNLGKIYLDQRRLDEARISLTRARDLDAQRFADLDRLSNASDPTGFLMDESISPEEIRSRIWGFSDDLTTIRNGLFDDYFPGISLTRFWALLSVVLVLSFGVGLKWPAGNVREAFGAAAVRPQSASVDVFDPKMSRAFKREYSPIHAYWEAFGGRWCTLLLPGLQHFFRENYLRGVFGLSLSLWLLIRGGFTSLLLRDPNSMAGLPSFPGTEFAFLVFGLVYLTEAIQAIRS
ncbi:MAG: tetratricopeptide repeat protein [Pseudomonadota bacterium]